MRRRTWPALAALLAVGVLAVPARAELPAPFAPLAPSEGSGAPREYVPGRVIVRFRPGTTAREQRAVRRRAATPLKQELLVPRAQLLQVDGSVPEAVDRLERQPDVEFAEPDYVAHGIAAAPSDPRFGDQWGVRNTGQTVNGVAGSPGFDVNVLPAWDTTRGAGQVIAVVDSGVALDQPDLAANLWSNPGDPPGNGDEDGNGKIDDSRGWDFVSNDNVPDAGHFHGTHVAGIAAAVANNAVGVAGVAPEAKIMPVRVLGDNDAGSASAIASGIVYAAEEGADVINLSLGGYGNSSTYSAALDQARAHDVVVATGAANDGTDNDTHPFYPCSLAHANNICTAGITQTGALWSGSNYGATTVDVGAPATNVLSSFPAFDELFTENFEAPLAGRWDTGGTNNSWARTTTSSKSPTNSLTDSPGADYANGTNSFAQMASGLALDLSGRRNCGLRFFLRGDVSSGDTFAAKWFATGLGEIGTPSRVAAPNFLDLHFEAPELGGRTGVRVVFRLQSDGAGTADGVYVDDVRLGCRGTAYDASDFRFLAGTSMATPHIAGIAALVRAAAPGLNADQVVEAIKAGAVDLPSLAGKTSTGGRADAAGAIAAAVGQAGGPGGTVGGGAGTAGGSSGGGKATGQAPDTEPPAAVVAGRRAQKLGKIVAVTITCDEPCVATATGTLSVPGSSRLYRLKKTSKPVAARGRATLKLKLPAKARRAAKRALKRRKKVRARITVVVADGRRNTASKKRTIVLKLR